MSKGVNKIKRPSVAQQRKNLKSKFETLTSYEVSLIEFGKRNNSSISTYTINTTNRCEISLKCPELCI